jgi:hypothetical protein
MMRRIIRHAAGRMFFHHGRARDPILHQIGAESSPSDSKQNETRPNR